MYRNRMLVVGALAMVTLCAVVDTSYADLPRPKNAAVVQPPSAYQWPLSGVPAVLRLFIPPPQPWMSGHRGVDLGGLPGQLVFPARKGIVHYAGTIAGVGIVSIEHNDGLLTTYQPVRSTLVVGMPVIPGQALGVLEAGHPGCPTSACLHWGLRRGQTYLDPLALLGRARVRLLPLVL